MIGSIGTDEMTGGTGADTFVIGSDALTLVIDDFITDYSKADGDVLDLSDIFATFGENAPATDLAANDAVQLVAVGGDTAVMVDDNGTAAGGLMVQVATLDGTHSTITIIYNDALPPTDVI